MKVEFRRSFVKDIKGVSDKSLLNKLQAAIEATENAPTLDDLTNCKKLKDATNTFD